MATYLSGNGGSVTGPGFAAYVTRWKYRDQVLLPDTGAMGDARDDHVVGPKGPGIATIEFLLATDADYDAAAFVAGGAIATLTLKGGAGGPNVAGTAAVESIDYDVDRRGVARGTATCKFDNDVTITDDA